MMFTLINNSLGQRQRQINEKVKESVKKKVAFEDIKDQCGTDIDTLFKVDLASNLRNTDYIVEILRSGDSLYVSRALKCSWLYDDLYSNIINADSIHQNIFPYMSIKMKKKFLTTLSVYIRNEERAASFYTYCADLKLDNIAIKFLIHTSEDFKKDIIKKGINHHMIEVKKTEYMKYFFGNSFSLLEVYLNSLSNEQATYLLQKVGYFYFTSNVKYIELLEKYVKIDPHQKDNRLSLRISKNIMKKHKSKVLRNPLVFLTVLNLKALVKYSSVADLKLFSVSVLPSNAWYFWSGGYNRTYKYILDNIPKNELFTFLKKIFTDKYTGEEFEMTLHFYREGYYEMLTTDERESWALRHIETRKGLLGSEQDYIWFRFVNYNKAVTELEKYILSSNDSYERAEIINVLVESARTSHDLQKLFQYYREKHLNEDQYHKETFVRKIIDIHNIFEFDDKCWNEFNKLLYNMEVYNDSTHHINASYRILILIYCILNNKMIPENIRENLYTENYIYIYESYNTKLSKEKREILFQSLIKLYIEKITEFKTQHNNEKENQIKGYIDMVICMLNAFKKSKDDCPIVVKEFIHLNWNEYKNHHLFREKLECFNERKLIRLLKKDATSTLSQFSLLRSAINMDTTFRLNQLTKKLKIYFSNDLAVEYLNFYLKLLSEPDTTYGGIYKSIYCIFQLASESFKNDFMLKYAPTISTIDRQLIDRRVLWIQKGICRYHCLSRPPVPISYTLMYLKGEYARFCLTMFYYYLSNLPFLQFMNFMEKVLDAPLSIKSYGLDFALKSYNVSKLNQLLLSIWKETKDRSIRFRLYKSLLNRLQNSDEESHQELYDVLKLFTSDINEEDHEELFSLFSYVTSYKAFNIPNKFKGDLLETAWTAFCKFSPNSLNTIRQSNMIHKIREDMSFIDRNFLRRNIIDQHIREMLIDDKIQCDYNQRDIGQIIDGKWELVAKFIVTGESVEANVDSVELVDTIVKLCAENWDKVVNGRYSVKEFFFIFIKKLIHNSNEGIIKYFKYVHCVFEKLLTKTIEMLPAHEIYLTVWDLRLYIIVIKVLMSFAYNASDRPFKNISMEKLYNAFAIHVGELIVDLAEKQQFHTNHLNAIGKILKEHIFVLCTIDIKCKAHIVSFCNGLLNFDIREAYLLVLALLSSNYIYKYYGDFSKIFEKIKKFDNYEVQNYFKDRFANTDIITSK